MTVVQGQVVQTINGAVNPVTSNRAQRWSCSLTDKAGTPLGALLGVEGGSLTFDYSAEVRGGGKLTILDMQEISTLDWTQVRIIPTLTIEGLPPINLGVFVPGHTQQTWGKEGRRVWDIEVLDKTSVIQQDETDATLSYAAGQVVTEAVAALIASTGESPGSLTPSTAALTQPLTFDIGVSKLTVINKLLAAIGYGSLWADGNGQFRVEPYVNPRNRTPVYDMHDDGNSIYLPENLLIANDIYAIPNKVIMVSQGDGTHPALVSEATNTDPNSPFSFQSRGRWIADFTPGAVATTQAALDAMAQARLSALSAPATDITVTHAPLPDWVVSEAVNFRRTPAGVDVTTTIQKVDYTLSATALATSVLRMVTGP